MEQSALFNIAALICGGILIVLLVSLFLVLAFQKSTIKAERIPSVKKLPEPAKPKNSGKPGLLSGISGSKSMARGNGRELSTNSRGGSSRMPDLGSLGLKTNGVGPIANAENTKNAHEKTPGEHALTEEKLAAAKMEIESPLPGEAREKDVIAAMIQVAGQVNSSEKTSTASATPAGAREEDAGKVPVTVPLSPASAAVPPAVAAPAAASEAEKPKVKKSGSLMDMFAEEEHEEAENNKMAKNLEQVDIHDLLEESQNLINSFIRR